MVLDICHTLNQFCAPLPLEYAEFKEMSNTVFPNILDTKVCLYLRTGISRVTWHLKKTIFPVFFYAIKNLKLFNEFQKCLL